MSSPVVNAALSAVVADLGLDPGEVAVLEVPDLGPARAGEVRAVAPQPTLLVAPGLVGDDPIAALRDACWPDRHFSAVYRADDGSVERLTLSGRERLDASAPEAPFTAVYVRTRDDALGRDTTRQKFDANAEGWNGRPGSPTYGHFRWMRKLLADVARPARGARVLDAGCGAGWVGIEAGRRGAMVSAYDPSPEMVRIARENAEASGIDLDARVGFVEDQPFEHAFDVVLNSGVISFAPDPDVYLAALDALVEPGGLLVIGDINPRSRGFARRRRRPLLPARELNGLPRAEVEHLLLARGYHVEARRLYQLTFPVPELMALCDVHGSGLGAGMLLTLNKVAAAIDGALGSPFHGSFDSWILRARKPS